MHSKVPERYYDNGPKDKDLFVSYLFRHSPSMGDDLDSDDLDERIFFLTMDVLDFNTCDFGADYDFGVLFLKIIEVILEHESFEYIEDKQQYKDYLWAVNFFGDHIEWGTSIRGAWFNYPDKWRKVMNFVKNGGDWRRSGYKNYNYHYNLGRRKKKEGE